MSSPMTSTSAVFASLATPEETPTRTFQSLHEAGGTAAGRMTPSPSSSKRLSERKTLTETWIRRLRPAPGGKRVQHRDAVVPGLVLRVTDRGMKTWVVNRRLGEKAIRHKLGAWPGIGLAKARDLARESLECFARG